MYDQLRGVYVRVRARTARDYIIRVGAAPLITVAGTGLVYTKIKTTKINSEGLLRLFTKFSTPENYPLYGTCWPYTVWVVHVILENEKRTK